VSIFRKTKRDPEHDPLSFAAWTAVREGAYACRVRKGTVSVEAHLAIARMDNTLNLTPASGEERLKTRVPALWSYQDYQALVLAVERVSAALTACMTGTGHVYVERMEEALVPYTKLIKKERAMERLTGEESERSK